MLTLVQHLTARHPHLTPLTRREATPATARLEIIREAEIFGTIRFREPAPVVPRGQQGRGRGQARQAAPTAGRGIAGAPAAAV
jgi:hypothetical protein